ncbi:hypothetical protein G6L35_05925 [Agrobacterium tumefaciens]|uniref:hypothetical protein n=1 Tax=Agrobacterium tumefaciens TaxID=358 RepID=UPI001573C269|nr:hypothetical protein [Agrobacterium tumefaciens]NSZ68164.1 hypothetical protein [Agrobacterium tumefaciens]
MSEKFGIYPEWAVSEVGGEELATTFRNKLLGGRRGKDGRKFEIAYGVSLVIEETAKLVSALQKGALPEDLSNYCFDEQPLAILDDFYLLGYENEFYAQLKSGEFTLPETMPDFAVQGLLDDTIGNAPNYKLVHTHYNMTGASVREIESFSRTSQEIFQYSTVYHDHAALNGQVYDALVTLTGSPSLQTQDEVYGAFFYQYWILEGSANLGDFLNKTARWSKHVREFELPETFEALTNEIMERCADTGASVVGQILRISHDGIMQGFEIPSDDAFADFVLWLGLRDELNFRQLVDGLERCGWRKPV